MGERDGLLTGVHHRGGVAEDRAVPAAVALCGVVIREPYDRLVVGCMHLVDAPAAAISHEFHYLQHAPDGKPLCRSARDVARALRRRRRHRHRADAAAGAL